MADRLIEAAGGVLWRPAVGGDGIEIALVHRPKYDDWSIPKGKLTSGEHPLLGALREVWEETGHEAVPGRPLGQIRYLKDGTPKRVRYWAMRVDNGRFTPNDEVDQLMWLPPREARRHLAAGRDEGRLLTALEAATLTTWPCVLVRHGSAGERSAWQGDDRERPLDELGQDQAEALVPLLVALRVRRVLSADVLRCLQTIAPYAEHARLSVESEPLMSEKGYAEQPDLALQRLLEVLCSTEASVVCSQGKTLPGLATGACSAMHGPQPPDASVRKGGLIVLHVAGDDRRARIVASDRFDPMA